jgi:hypothetical protein
MLADEIDAPRRRRRPLRRLPENVRKCLFYARNLIRQRWSVAMPPGLASPARHRAISEEL